MRTHLVEPREYWSKPRAYSSWLQKWFPEVDIIAPSEDSFGPLGEYRTIPYKDTASGRLRSALINLLPIALTYTTVEKESWFSHTTLPPNHTTLPVRIIVSIIVAILGRALLVVPMVIMSFSATRTKSLITVSCAVLLFAICLGAFMRSKNFEIFVATATYATILVLFVGTGGNRSG